MATDQEGKSIGEIFRESFHKGMEQATDRRARKAAAKRRAAQMSLRQQENTIRGILAGMADGTPYESQGNVEQLRGELATELEVWQELYDEHRRATD